MRKQVEILKLFVYIAVITSPKMNIVRYRGREVLGLLFDLLYESSSAHTSLLPPDVSAVLNAYNIGDEVGRKRVVCDFISSMTDRYAVELYNRFQTDQAQSIFKPI